MKPLCETIDNFKFESIINEQTKKKTWIVSGITMRAELKNGNNRIYSKPVLSGAINEHLKGLENGGCVGELKHPDNGDMNINPDRISHKFMEVSENGNDYYVRAKVCNTSTCGKQVQSLLEEGIQLGMSSRAIGNLDHRKDAIYVTKLHMISFGDIVMNPSCPGAFLDGIFEGQEWVWNAGILVGKDLSENIDNYKNIIESAPRKDRDKAVTKVLSDYFRDIIGD